MFAWRSLSLGQKFVRIALLQILILMPAIVVIVIIQDQFDSGTLERIETRATQNELANDIRVEIVQLERIQQTAFEQVREPGFNPETTGLFTAHSDVVEEIREQSELLQAALLSAGDAPDVAINSEFEALDAGIAEVEEDFTEFFLLTQQLTDPQTGALVTMRNAGSELAADTEVFLQPQIILIQDFERSLVEVGEDDEWGSLTTAVQNVRDQTGRGSVIVNAEAYQAEIATVQVLIERVSTLEEQATTSFSELSNITERIVTLSRSGVSTPVDGGEAASGIILLLALAAMAGSLIFFGRSVQSEVVEVLNLSTRMSSTATLEPEVLVVKSNEIALLRSRLADMGVQRDELEVEMRARIARATRDLNITAEIGRVIVDAVDPVAMTNKALEVILEGFDFYFAQVFLVSGSQANLVASTTRDGRDVSERQYSVPVGAETAVGQVTVTGTPVLLDGDDTIGFHEASEVLGRSRAQLTVPMRIGTQVTGALDIQSDRNDVLQEDMIAVFQIVADQLAVALESARLTSEVNTLEQRLGSTQQANVGQRWADFLRQQQGEMALAYLYDNSQVDVLTEPIPSHMEEALERGTLMVTGNGDGDPNLTVPIRIRDQVIGVFNFSGPYLNQLSEEDKALVETVVDRVGLALENLRLVQQATQRAEYEQIVNDITTQIVGSTDVNFILQTTVRELGRILGAPQTSVQLKRGDADGRK